MTPEEFETTKAIFEFAKKGLRNDETLGDFLVTLGAQLVALGVRELRARPAPREAETTIKKER